MAPTKAVLYRASPAVEANIAGPGGQASVEFRAVKAHSHRSLKVAQIMVGPQTFEVYIVSAEGGTPCQQLQGRIRSKGSVARFADAAPQCETMRCVGFASFMCIHKSVHQQRSLQSLMLHVQVPFLFSTQALCPSLTEPSVSLTDSRLSFSLGLLLGALSEQECTGFRCA